MLPRLDRIKPSASTSNRHAPRSLRCRTGSCQDATQVFRSAHLPHRLITLAVAAQNCRNAATSMRRKGFGVAAALRRGGFPATSAGAGPAGVAALRVPGRVAGCRHCVRNAAALAGQGFRENVAAWRPDFAPRAPPPAPAPDPAAKTWAQGTRPGRRMGVVIPAPRSPRLGPARPPVGPDPRPGAPPSPADAAPRPPPSVDRRQNRRGLGVSQGELP
jgi:hypothetical protein